MCSPALAVMAITTAISAYSSISAGNAQAAQAEYQADVAENDAKLERSAAQVRADKIRRAGLLREGEARVALAGSGVDVNAGTSVEINREIVKNTEADALAEIVDGGNRAARLQSDASASRISGSNAKQAGNIGAASALISGGSQFAKGWKVYSASKTT